MTGRERRTTFLVYAGFIVGSSALFALVFPGPFAKIFGIALVVLISATLLGLGNFLFWRKVDRLPEADRAHLKRAGFHVGAALATGVWAWMTSSDDFLGRWFVSYVLVAVVGMLGAVADLAGKFEEGYKAVVDDLKAGRYPRDRD